VSSSSASKQTGEGREGWQRTGSTYEAETRWIWPEMYACFGGRSHVQFASIPLVVSPPCLLLSTPNLITQYSSMFADSQFNPDESPPSSFILRMRSHRRANIQPTSASFLGNPKIQNLRVRSPSPERRNASLTRSKSTMPQYKPLALIPRQAIRSSTHICRIIIFRIL
jgi:hypothetical protein